MLHRIVPVAFFCAMLSACAYNPATGERQFTALMSPRQEVEIGRKEHPKALRAFGGAYEDAALQSYIGRIGAELVRGTEVPGQAYHFTVLDSPVVNAFAIPGGYVYVTRGLLALANSEAEVAAVLGHEIAHVTARHSAERYSQSVVVGLLGEIVNQSLAADVPSIGNMTSVGSDLFLKSYSRGQEHEADGLGIRYIARQGYDPFAASRFFETMEMNDALQQRLGKGDGRGLDFFATHPRTEDRIVKATQTAGTYATTGNEKINSESYLRAIDGMVYGASEDEGYVRGNTFLHPKLGFAFDVPPGFKIQNRPKEVLAQNDEGVSIVFDATRAKDINDPVTFLTGIWAPNVNLSNVEAIDVNGRAAATGTLVQMTRKGPVDLRLVAIRWGKNEFFRFVFVTPASLTRAYVGPLRQTTHTLRTLTAREARANPPARIRVITVRPGDTIASLSAQMDVEELKEEHFRTLNRLRSNASLKPGQLVKIVSAR